MKRLVAACLLTCPLGQACSPLVFELAHDGSTQALSEPGTTGDPTTGTTAPFDTTHEPPSGPGGDPDSAGFSCHDGAPGPGETDIDCGGPCPPCQPGQACVLPEDCDTGVCNFGKCDAPACKSDDECKVAAPEHPCMRGQCDPGGTCTIVPAFDGEPCDDFDACTLDSTCVMGQCLGAPRSCDEFGGPCRKGFCNPQTGNCAAEFAFEGEPCEDGDMCTLDEACFQGECIAPAPQPLFVETFAMPQDWQQDPPWQIGELAPSQCWPEFDDPLFTPSGDTSLAGTAIGGCLPPDMLPPTCLTSPKLPKAPDQPPLALSFASWLAADKPVIATVEMFDGNFWFPLTEVTSDPQDPNWDLLAVDLPLPVDAPVVQVRFCLAQPEPMMGMFGGWSIDDVVIGPIACAP